MILSISISNSFIHSGEKENGVPSDDFGEKCSLSGIFVWRNLENSFGGRLLAARMLLGTAEVS